MNPKPICSSRTYSNTEPLLLMAILFIAFKTILFIHLGFDPHHDAFSYFPGYYAFNGLTPHLDFYTHYGAVDAFFKAYILRLFDGSIYSLRITCYVLDVISLLIVCYGSRRKRRFRLIFLMLIAIWAAFDPPSGAVLGTSYWHHMAWSSDLAIPLICTVLLTSFWLYYLASLSISAKPNNVYSRSLAAIVTLAFSQGASAATIFFTKVSIGLCMIVAILITNCIFSLSSRWNNELTTKKSINFLETSFPNKGSRYSRGSLLILIHFSSVAGLLIVGYTWLMSIGGFQSLHLLYTDTMVSNYAHFKEQLSFMPVLNIIVNKVSIISYSMVIVFLVYLRREQIGRLYFSVILFVGFVFVPFFLWQTEYLDYVQYFAYASAFFLSISLLEIMVSFINKDRKFSNDTDTICFSMPAFTIGALSLCQFFPINDPFHVWWSISTALPGCAVAIVYQVNKTKRFRAKEFGKAIIVFTLISATWSLVMTTNDIHNLKLSKIYVHGQPVNALNGLLTSDQETSNRMQELSHLSDMNPHVVFYEENWPQFLNLFRDRKKVESQVSCRIIPNTRILPKSGRQEYLNCLSMMSEGKQDIAFTSHLPDTTRTVANRRVQAWATIGMPTTPDIVREYPENFELRAFGGTKYWMLKKTFPET